MTKEVTREVTEHANQIGQLQGGLESVKKSVDEVKGTQKEIFDKIDRTEKYLADKIDRSHCRKEDVLREQSDRLKIIEEDLAPLKMAKHDVGFTTKAVEYGWKIGTGVILFYIAVRMYLNGVSQIP